MLARACPCPCLCVRFCVQICRPHAKLPRGCVSGRFQPVLCVQNHVWGGGVVQAAPRVSAPCLIFIHQHYGLPSMRRGLACIVYTTLPTVASSAGVFACNLYLHNAVRNSRLQSDSIVLHHYKSKSFEEMVRRRVFGRRPNTTFRSRPRDLNATEVRHILRTQRDARVCATSCLWVYTRARLRFPGIVIRILIVVVTRPAV